MAAKSTDIVVPVVEENCKMNDYNNTFMGALSKLRDEKEYCDFLLQVGGETIHVHRAALAISSPYFKALLKSNMKENQLGSVTFEDKDVNAVKAIIGFIYSGQITLTEENVQAIYLTSDYFQMEWLKKRCVEFLKRHLRGANCIQIRSFADKLSFKELYDCSHKYILNNFDMLIDNKELLLLSFEEILGLIKDDQLSVKLEENAYIAAINWIKYNVEDRKAHLTELMSHIRLRFVRTRFLTKYIMKESLLERNLQCKDFIIEALSYQAMLKDCLSENSQSEEIRGVCKMAGENLNTAEYYNPFTKRWSCIANMNYARKNFGICAYKDCIYVMGGCGTSLSTEIFNPSTDRWYAQTTDNTINYNFCNRIALIENSIYTLGYKFDGIITCTRFDPRDGRFYKLYNVGGENMETFEVFSSDHSLYCIQNNYFVRLDVRINKWERMPLMPRERSNFSAIMLEDNIYVFGGMTIKSNHDDSALGNPFFKRGRTYSQQLTKPLIILLTVEPAKHLRNYNYKNVSKEEKGKSRNSRICTILILNGVDICFFDGHIHLCGGVKQILRKYIIYALASNNFSIIACISCSTKP
ncbi:kelch-like protein diablo [Glossina fuscipes]|uniref:Kelch-like protein diablo n=1 Tax=Glossina fuscipes TaxID=7396 RepID=A0A9C5Z9I3_9MUSC|nr:kelch-like protein diablo [Glossina fuscipes]